MVYPRSGKTDDQIGKDVVGSLGFFYRSIQGTIVGRRETGTVDNLVQMINITFTRDNLTPGGPVGSSHSRPMDIDGLIGAIIQTHLEVGFRKGIVIVPIPKNQNAMLERFQRTVNFAFL